MSVEKDINEIKQALARFAVSLEHLENDLKNLSEFCKNHLATEISNLKIDVVRLYERVNIITAERKTTKQRIWDIILLCLGAIVTSGMGGIIGALISKIFKS
jgi:chromosome segregation ATPase